MSLADGMAWEKEYPIMEERKMKIAGNEVKNVTRDTAEVGCTKVTRAEAEALLKEMNAKPAHKDFEISVVPGGSDYLNFTIRHLAGGWISAEPEQESVAGRTYNNKSAFFCLERDSKAKKLLKFLAEQLGYTLIKNAAKAVIEVRSVYGTEGPSPWNRSGNLDTKGEYSFDEATTRAAAEQKKMSGGYEYRAVPLEK